MSTSSHIDQHSANCDALLLEAIQLYRQMLDSYTAFQKNFTAITLDGSERQMSSLKSLMEKVQVVDDSIEKTLPDSSSFSKKTQALVDERDQLLRSLLAVNTAITSKAVNVKSLIFHELTNMRSKRSAVQGYKNSDVRKNIIQNSV